MQVSMTNTFPDTGTLTVGSDDDVNQTKANMESVDFSSKYTSAGTSSNFNIQKTYSGGRTISYIAIIGHNIGANGADVVTVKCNNTTKGTLTVSSEYAKSKVLMFTFAETASVTDIDVEIAKASSSTQITITGIMAGEYLDIPNGGEQAGFPRNYLTRSKKQRVMSNAEGGPVAILSRTFARPGRLSVKNVTQTFIEADDWQSFLDMCFDSGYFVFKERDGGDSTDDPASSALAFDVDLSVKAHAQTRELVSFDAKFKTYTGT